MKEQGVGDQFYLLYEFQFVKQSDEWLSEIIDIKIDPVGGIAYKFWL